MQVNSLSKVYNALNMAVSVLKSFKVPDNVPDAEAYKFATFISYLESALKTSRRNCDVGTADDWLARFRVVCEHCSGSDCDHRLFKDEEVCDCFARWLQMPYKGGDKK